MMTERRLEALRRSMTRPLEIHCLDSGKSFRGESVDLSDGGLRAMMLDDGPPPGATVMLHLYFDDLVTPVESFGRVAWRSSLPVGDGLQVGLMLGTEEMPAAERNRRPDLSVPAVEDCRRSIESEQTVVAVQPLPAPLPAEEGADEALVLKPGEKLHVSFCGHPGQATICDVGTVDEDGHVLVTLRLKDVSSFAVPVASGVWSTPESDDIDVSAWRADPLHNAVSLVKQYGGPALAWLRMHGTPLAVAAVRYGRPAAVVLLDRFHRIAARVTPHVEKVARRVVPRMAAAGRHLRNAVLSGWVRIPAPFRARAVALVTAAIDRVKSFLPARTLSA